MVFSIKVPAPVPYATPCVVMTTFGCHRPARVISCISPSVTLCASLPVSSGGAMLWGPGHFLDFGREATSFRCRELLALWGYPGT